MKRLSIITASALVAGCNRGIMDPAGPVAAAEKTILINSTAIMLAIIIPTMMATIAFAWWFRRGNSKAEYRPDWEYSGAIEMVVWSIPALTIMLLGGITWIGFFVPQFGSMIYTMPRMTTRLHLQADRQGVYDGLSSHYSGEGFSGMR